MNQIKVFLTLSVFLVALSMSAQLVRVNNTGITMLSVPTYPQGSTTNAQFDANGESHTFIGKCFLQSGSGSKTISSAGGKVLWRSTTTVFANAASTLRIGIQDVAASGLEDGVFDVSADLVGATDAIGNNADLFTPMETGTKTISHGDLIAISFELVTRGGVDIVRPFVQLPNYFPGSGSIFPYRTNDIGAGPVRVASGTFGATIEFDDGTLGWIEPFPFLPTNGFNTSTLTYNSGSANKEYCGMFQVPFKVSINAMAMYIGSIAATDNFEMILYRNPLTAPPVAVQTIAVDPDYTGSTTSAGLFWVSIPSTTLLPNTWYAIAARPTTANSISIGWQSFGSGNQKYKDALPFTNVKFGNRTNTSNAFSETNVHEYPLIGINIEKIHDGTIETSTSF